MKNFKSLLVGALFGLLAITQVSAQSIVGAWSGEDSDKEGAGVLVFFATGTFYYIENVPVAELPEGFPGYERGTYTWNAATNALTLTVLQDTNGNTGIGGASGLTNMTAVVAGNTLTITAPGAGSLVGTRVAGTSPIVGGWLLGDPAVNNGSSIVVFLPNGVYFMAEDGDSTPGTGDPSGRDGIEHGTYSWNAATGVITASQSPAPYVDTNGEWGLSHTGGMLTITVSADGLSLLARVGTESYPFTRAGAAVAPPAPVATTVFEFYNAAFDHYFITYVADEIAKLDNGTFVGWARTGLSFKAFATLQAATSAVCRIYIPPGKGNGHFFGRDTNECAGTMTKNPTFILESSAFFYLYPPTLGNCGAGQIPVYRLFSNRIDANHRYTTSRTVRDQMVARGWIAEGDGADIVVMCAPQ